jgi:hypothetical protein
VPAGKRIRAGQEHLQCSRPFGSCSDARFWLIGVGGYAMMSPRVLSAGLPRRRPLVRRPPGRPSLDLTACRSRPAGSAGDDGRGGGAPGNREPELHVVPRAIPGARDIKHTVASRGADVLAAGEADIAGSNGVYYGTPIDNRSGHTTNPAWKASPSAGTPSRRSESSSHHELGHRLQPPAPRVQPAPPDRGAWVAPPPTSPAHPISASTGGSASSKAAL